MKSRMICIFLAIAVLTIPNIALPAEHVMKIAGVGSPKIAAMYVGVLMEQEIEKRSKGRIDVQFFHSGQMGGEVEFLDKLNSGVIQGSLNSCAILERINPFISVMQLPYLFPTWDKVHLFLKSDLSQEVLNSFTKLDLKGLGYSTYGFHTLATNKPFKTLEDLKGFKFRSAESPLFMETLRLLGINPTPLPYTEVYQALKTGVFDGIDNTAETFQLAKWGEVLKYISDTNHMVGWYVTLVKKSWMDKLPSDLREIVSEVGKEASQQSIQMLRENEIKALKAFESSGTTIVRLSDDERMKFKKRLQPIHEKRKDIIGIDFLNKMYKYLDYKP